MARKRSSAGNAKRGTPGVSGSAGKKKAGSSRRSSGVGPSAATAGASRSAASTSEANPVRYELGSYVEAADGAQKYYPAKVVDVEHGPNPRIRIHFLNWSKIFDEWVPTTSARLRPVSKEAADELARKSRNAQSPGEAAFKPGDIVHATWLNKRKYDAKILGIEEENSDPSEILYSVRFTDGFIHNVLGKNIRLMNPKRAKKIVFSEKVILREEKKFMYDDSKPEEVASREERRQRSKKLDFKEILGMKRRSSSGHGSGAPSPAPPANGGEQRATSSAGGEIPQVQIDTSEPTGRRGVKRPQRYVSPPPAGAPDVLEVAATPTPPKPLAKKQKTSRASKGRRVTQPYVEEPQTPPAPVQEEISVEEVAVQPEPEVVEESVEEPAEDEPMPEESQDEGDTEGTTARFEESQRTDSSVESEDESQEAVPGAEAPSVESQDEASSEEEPSVEEDENAEDQPEATDVEPEALEAEESEVAASEEEGTDEDTSATTEDEAEKEGTVAAIDAQQPLHEEMEVTAPHAPEQESQSEEEEEDEEYHSAEEEPSVADESIDESVEGSAGEEGSADEEHAEVEKDSVDDQPSVEEGSTDDQKSAAEEESTDEQPSAEEESADEEPAATEEGSADDQPASTEEESAASEEEDVETTAPQKKEPAAVHKPAVDPSFMPAATAESPVKTVERTSVPTLPSAVPPVDQKKKELAAPVVPTGKPGMKVSHPSVLVTLRPPSLPIVTSKADQSIGTAEKSPLVKSRQSARERKPSLKVALAQGTASATTPQPQRTATAPLAPRSLPPLSSLKDATPTTSTGTSIFEPTPEAVLHEHRCPVEKCRKIFRRPHLLQMHIKHTHAEYEHLVSAPSVIAMAQNRTEGANVAAVAPPKPGAAMSAPLPMDDSKVLKQTIAELEAKKALDAQREEFLEPQKEALVEPQPKLPLPMAKDALSTPTTSESASSKKKKKKKSRISLDYRRRSKKKRPSAAAAAPLEEPESMEVVEELATDEVMEEEVPVELEEAPKPPSPPPAVEEPLAAGVEEPPAAPIMPAPPQIVGPMLLRTNKKKGAGYWAVQQEDQPQQLQPPAPLPITAPPPMPAITAPPPLPAIMAAKQESATGLPTPPQSRSGGSSNHFADDVSSSDAWGEDSAVETDGGTAAEQPSAAAFDIICCLCRSTENEGLMIQCDTCLTWQHGTCEKLEETAIPDNYECTTCRNPRLQRPSMKFMHDQKYLKTGVLPKPAALEDLDAGDKETVAARKKLHDLFAHIVNVQDMFPSLEHKINIARNINHPKLVQWAKAWTSADAPELSYDEVRRIASLLESTLLRSNAAAVGVVGTSEGLAGGSVDMAAAAAGTGDHGMVVHGHVPDGAHHVVPSVDVGHSAGGELALVSDLAEWIAIDGAATGGPSIVDVVQPPPIPVFKAPELKRIEPQECQANLLAHVEDVQNKLEGELHRITQVLDDVEKQLAAPDLKPETRHALMNFLAKFIPKEVPHAGAE